MPPHALENAAELSEYFASELAEHRAVFEATAQLAAEQYARPLAILESTVRSGGKILLCGNGGSAADAQHIAAELVVRYKADRPAIAAVALTTDCSTLTAGGNDLGFDTIFARQVEALARPGDAVIGISTSGRSPNVVTALRQARRLEAKTIGLSGGDGGALAELCDALIIVPSRVTARIQEMHILIGHMLCKALEQRLGLV